MLARMLQRLPHREAKRRRQARWRERQRRDLIYVGGDVPRRVVENLIDTEWLRPEEAADRRAIMAAMVAALNSVRK
jgi:hypothetical protein